MGREVEILKRRVKELETLNRLAQIISSTMDVNQILKIIIEEAINLASAEQGSVMIVDEESPRGMRTLVRGRREEREPVYRLATQITGWIIKNKKPLLSKDIRKDSRFKGLRLVSLPFRSVLSVPLKVGKEIIGSINLMNREGEFSEDDMRLLSIIASQSAQVVQNARSHEKLSEENVYLRREVEHRYKLAQVIGKSPAMQKVFELLDKVIPGEANVFLEGETGTGKELIARTIHYNGPRRSGKFIAVDCGAIPESLMESELFGYIKGAFTGAVKDKKGLFAEADGGTLFLDEITNTSPSIQAKLLRAIQEREIRPVGATQTRRVDVRIISATSSDLKAMVKQGSFREDLYYRLRVISIRLPPLRERREDIPVLAHHFLKKNSKAMGKDIKGYTPDAISLLEGYSWPGNVREMENVVERAVTLASSDTERIGIELLPDELREVSPIKRKGFLPGLVAEFEKERIVESLRENNWIQLRAAKALGIPLGTLRDKIKKYNIKRI